MIDVLLINSPSSLKDRFGSLGDVGSNMAPIGICSLASYLRNNNITPMIIDESILDLNTLIKKIKTHNPKIIGISAVTMTVEMAGIISQKIKNKFFHIPIVIGGVHISSLPEETMNKYSFFDYGVIGEGELTALELFSKLLNKQDISNVKGIIFRQKNKLIKTPSRNYINELDILPFPAFDLLDSYPEKYNLSVLTSTKFPSTSLITTRGCKGFCTFCDRTVFGRKVRAHSAEYVIEMIKYVQNDFNIKEIEFVDDNFLLLTKRVNKICDYLINNKIRIIWNCYGRIDSINTDILKKIRHAGCWQIGWGIESGSPRILKLLNKGIKINEVKKVLTISNNTGIVNRGLFMIGNCGETKKSIIQTLNLILTLPLKTLALSRFTPFPGSAIYKKINLYGKTNLNWSKMNMWSPVFVPNGLTEKEIEFFTNKIYKIFYLRIKIILYFLSRLKNKYTIIRTTKAIWYFIKNFFNLKSYVN